MRIPARGTSRFALVASGAGNFALRAHCKWRGELRFFQRTARMPCRNLALQLRIFAKQKCGSERAVSKVGYFFDSLPSLKLSHLLYRLNFKHRIVN